MAFGSNIGDRKQNFATALKYLHDADNAFCILKKSQYLVTEPFQNPLYNTLHSPEMKMQQGASSRLAASSFPVSISHQNYLNFVCDVITSFHPFSFYQDLIVPIEDTLGHSRTEKWASRALDIDVLLGAQNNQNDFKDCSPIIIDNEIFSLPHAGLLEPERVVIKNMLRDELNLDYECIKCHFKQIMCVKN